MSEQVAVVTGAARGIGLELCRLLAERGYTVIAASRRAARGPLSALAAEHPGRLHEVVLDVGSDAAVAAGARAIAERVDHVDLLINNAGIYPEEDGLERLDTQALVDAYQVNAVGPLRVIRALLPLLRRGRGRRTVQITSLMGSIEDNGSGGSYAYRMSKAALNMATRNLAHELGPEGFVTLAVHPGWVATEMGGPAAPLAVRPAAEEVLRVALEAKAGDNGGFLGPGSEPLPW
jgi:NAD(P)-dependent dehydrogenase (short-subunit alcohol dehydrogenase family)